jgi:hypothetical protein
MRLLGAGTKQPSPPPGSTVRVARDRVIAQI